MEINGCSFMKRRVQSWPGARQENRCSLCLVFRIGHIVFSMERERRRRQLPTTKLRTWVLVCLVGSLVSSPPNAGLIAMAFLFFFHFQRYQMVKEISLGKKKEKEKQRHINLGENKWWLIIANPKKKKKKPFTRDIIFHHEEEVSRHQPFLSGI